MSMKRLALLQAEIYVQWLTQDTKQWMITAIVKQDDLNIVSDVINVYTNRISEAYKFGWDDGRVFRNLLQEAIIDKLIEYNNIKDKLIIDEKQ